METFQIVYFIFIAFVAIISLILVIFFIDSFSLSTQKGYGKVINKKHNDEYTSYSFSPITKTTMPYHHDDEWILVIEKDGLTDEFEVKKKNYKKALVGNTYEIEYSYGRLSKSLYVQNIII